MNSKPRIKLSNGFTLIELLVTIAIAGILFGVAIPSFREVINNNRLTSQSNQFVSAMTYARSEAVRRGVDVTLLNLGTAPDWAADWVVFIDTNGDQVVDTGEVVLRNFTYTSSNVDFFSTTNGARNFFIFEGSGYLKGAMNRTFRLCATGSDNNYREIVVSMLGRARIEEKTGVCPP